MSVENDQAPTVERSNRLHYDSTERHPAYGQIGASRVSGKTRLYGSDFEHNAYVVISISDSTMQRGLSHDWPHPNKELIQVALSEAQWATFVSTLNSGSGTQCTLERIAGQRIPGIAKTTDRREQFKAEMAATVEDARVALNKLRDSIDGLKIPLKAKDELLSHIRGAIQQLDANVPFVAKSFDEHVERNVERAKIEVNAYLSHIIARAGITALGAGGQQPFQLGDGKENEP